MLVVPDKAAKHLGNHPAASLVDFGGGRQSEPIRTWLSKFPQATFDHPLTYYQIPETYDGTTITLYAWLSTPPGNGPFPVVILAHGCNGLFETNTNGTYVGAWPQYTFWADWLISKGYGVLFLDSYTGRGINNVPFAMRAR